ncbi:Molybdopterin molybdenumtransferase [hydrothermal vent metagenome]|uniref:molybdopterin molybdotransferase n=1 Tax=hydrothermal vent metagenome TaxID=652676 RepID=A0A3B1AII8_9ZZZZ
MKNMNQSQSSLMSLKQALEKILADITPIDMVETLTIIDAFGRVLAEPITSPLNVPPYQNSAMDGYAVRSADLPDSGDISLKLIGTSWAGTPFAGEVGEKQCVRIMTGAKMPEGANTVIMQEQVQVNDQQISIGDCHQAGQHVRHIGEDIKEGDVVLQPGKSLNAAELGLLASLGIAKVKVYRPLKAAFFSTGDELRAVGETLEEGQIYDSNRYTIFGMLKGQGVEIHDLGVIRDKREDVEAAFKRAAELADIVFTSGGVSVGDADFVKQTLEKLGTVNLWKIAMKPGKPLAFGRIDKAYFFGLPGNPVSAMATFYQVALPALHKLMGKTPQPALRLKLRCLDTLKKRPGRIDFQRGILDYEGDELVVRGVGAQGSHILSSMSRANCFIILSAEQGMVEAGSEVEVQPFSSLM